MAYRIKNLESLEGEVRRIAHEEVRGAMRDIRKAHSHSDVMHAVRSRCKKMRALLRLVRSGLRKQYRIENHAFRDIARGLSRFRDATVMRATIDSLLTLDSISDSPIDSDYVRANLATGLEEGLDEDAFRRALEEAQEALHATAVRIASWRVRGKPMRILAAGLGETYQRARDLFSEAATTQEARELHEWRKHVKHHWLQLKLIRPISSKALPGRMKRMGQLSDALGNLHDLDVLEAWLAQQPDHGLRQAAGTIAGLAAQRRAQLRATAFGLGSAAFTRRRREFVDAVIRPRDSATARRTS
jgi:CHAD domain-containing protein